jgi:hypothetical protein
MMMPGAGGARFSPLAIIAMITGILSIPTCFCSCFAPGLNSPLAITAIVCGFRGTGFAIAGICTGAVGMILVLLAALTNLDDNIWATVHR